MAENICLESIGWSLGWRTAFDLLKIDDCLPARVSAEHRAGYELLSPHGRQMAQITGKLRYGAEGRQELPAVGDWVAARLHPGGGASIHAILPRKSTFSRKVAGARSEEQVIAANIDTVFIVSGLDNDFNLRRIERYLTLAYDSGANPVILLNKADLCQDPGEAIGQVMEIAPGVPVLLLSATQNAGLEEMIQQLKPGQTGALLGSSGVGKSTLINALLGRELMKTAAVREDDSRGRHTTTTRQLIPLDNGAALIDTPGMRELQLLGDEQALAHSFADIDAFAEGCRFGDCTHTEEPGCAVKKAVSEGSLDDGRYQSYLRQRKEMRYLQSKQDVFLQKKEKRRYRAAMKSMKNVYKWRERQ